MTRAQKARAKRAVVEELREAIKDTRATGIAGLWPPHTVARDEDSVAFSEALRLLRVALAAVKSEGR